MKEGKKKSKKLQKAPRHTGRPGWSDEDKATVRDGPGRRLVDRLMDEVLDGPLLFGGAGDLTEFEETRAALEEFRQAVHSNIWETEGDEATERSRVYEIGNDGRVRLIRRS